MKIPEFCHAWDNRVLNNRVPPSTTRKPKSPDNRQLYYSTVPVPTTSAYRFQRSRPTRGGTVRQQTTPTNRDHYYPDSAVRLSGFSVSGQFAVAELILNSTTKPLRRRSDRTQLLLLLMAGDIHPNPGPTAKYPCPVCVRDVTSRGVSYRWTKCTGWVHAKCSGLLNAAQYRRNKDWTFDPCSASKTQQWTPPPPSPSPTPSPSAEQISDDSTFNVLQFNANGIGNKLTELGVVLERNKVKVVVIQESKLSSKSKNPCIRNYATVRKDRPHGHGGGLLVVIHESITFYKQPSSTETQSDPHMEELTIKADIENTKLTISNIYIPPASSCSNGYQSSIEHILMTPDTLILGDCNAHHSSWYSRSTDTRRNQRI